MRALATAAFPAAVLGVALASAPARAETRPPRDDDAVLTGMVPNAWSRSEAERVALEEDDVKSVANHLTVARGESDADVARTVADHLRRYVLYSIFDDVSVGVEDGKVTLTGEVTAPYKASDLERIAAKVTGVQAVANEVRTLPASSYDDRLRAEIASRLYGDPMFESYALQVPPPIHIVVENGHVTLTGAVGSEVERAKAGFTAREVFGVMSVDNRLKVAS